MSNKAIKPPKKNVLALDGMTIEIESFKQNEFDRGTKKVFVNFEQWGWIHTKWHGSHGTTFHLSDLHGTVYRPNPRRDNQSAKTDVLVRSPNKRHLRIANIGKAEQDTTPIPTNESIILRLIAEAVENGWLRSPATRDAEREAVRAEGYRRDKAAKQKHEIEWNNQIDRIIGLGVLYTVRDSTGLVPHSVKFEIAPLRQAIYDAMKWAQTQ